MKTNENLSRMRQKISVELGEWGAIRAGAAMGVIQGTHTAEQVAYADAKLKELKDRMYNLNRPRRKQIRWVGQGFKK